MSKKDLTTKSNPTDVILGDTIDVGKDHPNYTKSKEIQTVDSEQIEVENPNTGKKAIVTINRNGTSEEKLGALMLSPDATREQKDSMIAQYMFEQGKDNASFLAELFLSKGKLTRETQAFKKAVRFDFESFANTIAILFQDLANDLKDPDLMSAIGNFSARLEQGANLIIKQREAMTEERMKEKGYGIYIDRSGKAYSIFDSEIEDVVKQEKEDITKPHED